jgi:hypothetical protein
MQPGTVRPTHVPAAMLHLLVASSKPSWVRRTQRQGAAGIQRRIPHPSLRLGPWELGLFCTFHSEPPAEWKLGLFRTFASPTSNLKLQTQHSCVNWVRFAYLPRVPCPCGPVPPGTAGKIGFVLPVCQENWLCFAQSVAGVSADRRKLGLFRRIGFVSHDSLRPIGFVLRISSPGRRPGVAELASFCTFRPPAAHPAPGPADRRPGVPPRVCPESAIRNPGIGFVLHNRPPAPVNWVCFARMPLTGIGFVLHDRLALRRPPDTPGRPSLALFRMFSPWRSAFLRARRNWLCLYGIPPTDYCLPTTGYRHLALFRTNTDVSSFRFPIINMSFPRRRES